MVRHRLMLNAGLLPDVARTDPQTHPVAAWAHPTPLPSLLLGRI